MPRNRKNVQLLAVWQDLLRRGSLSMTTTPGYLCFAGRYDALGVLCYVAQATSKTTTLDSGARVSLFSRRGSFDPADQSAVRLPKAIAQFAFGDEAMTDPVVALPDGYHSGLTANRSVDLRGMRPPAGVPLVPQEVRLSALWDAGVNYQQMADIVQRFIIDTDGYHA